MEYIVINGVPVEVPREITAEGREAVAHWYAAQLAAAGGEGAAEPKRKRERGGDA